jgi:adenosylcobinamide kinase/adenosylcobinamide-phosphate guanylyltransferase
LLASADDVTYVTYVATAYPAGHDPEWTERVAAHQARRPSSWTTVETTDLVPLLGTPGGPLLVDCLTLWLTRVIDAHDGWLDEEWTGPAAAAVAADVDALVAAVAGAARDVVLVTNEVGQGVVPATASGRRFRDEMGVLNVRAAEACDDVLWCVAGRVVRL